MLKHALVPLLLALAALTFTWRGFVPGHVLLPLDLVAEFGLWKPDPDVRRSVSNRALSDVIVQFVPWDTEIRRHLANGDAPWVDRFAGEGAPLFANPQAAIFSPFTWPRLLWGERGWALSVFLRLWCAGLGASFLARTLGATRPAAGLSGGVYLASAYSIGWAMHPLANVTACLPWLAAGLIRLTQNPSARTVALTILAAAGATAGGHPESLAMAVIAIAVMLLWHTPRDSRRRLGWCAVTAATGFATLAVVTVPFLYLVGDSEAAQWRARQEPHAFRAPAVAAQILPGWLGGPLADELDLSRLTPAEAGYQMRTGSYLGALVLLALGLAGRQLPVALRRGVAIGGVALFLSWCPPVVEQIVGRLPLLDLTLPTYRAVGFVLFGSAAAGPALLLAAARPRPRLAAALAAVGGGLLLIGATPAIPAARTVMESVARAGLVTLDTRGLLPHPVAVYEQRLPTYLDLAATTARRRLALPGVTWLLAGIALACRGSKARLLFAAAALGELVAFGCGYLPAVPAAELPPAPSPLTTLRRLDPGQQFRVIASRGVLPPNLGTWLSVRDPRSYVVIENAEEMARLRAMGYVTTDQRSFPSDLEADQWKALAEAGVRFALMRQPVPDARLLAGGPAPIVGLYELPGARATPLPVNRPPRGLGAGLAVSAVAVLCGLLLMVTAARQQSRPDPVSPDG